MAAAGEITPLELTAHLEHCSVCRRSREMLCDAAKGFAALREVEAPDPRAAIRARLAQPRSRAPLFLTLVGGVAACGVVVALLLMPRPAQPTASPGDRPHAMAQAAVERPQPPCQVAVESAAKTHTIHSGRNAAVALRPRRHRAPLKMETPPPAARDDEEVMPVVQTAETPATRLPALSRVEGSSSQAEQPPGKVGAYVNRMIGMALTSSLLPSKDGNG